MTYVILYRTVLCVVYYLYMGTKGRGNSHTGDKLLWLTGSRLISYDASRSMSGDHSERLSLFSSACFSPVAGGGKGPCEPHFCYFYLEFLFLWPLPATAGSSLSWWSSRWPFPLRYNVMLWKELWR